MDAIGVMQRLGMGHFPGDLHGSLLRVSEEVVATGNRGSVTVTFTIDQVKGEPAVTIVEKIKESLPASDSKGAIFYAVDGELSKGDPRQEVMQFRVVEGEMSDVRVPADAGVVREAE